MTDQLHKQFEKSIAALGFDMTREGTGYANQRTNDTWRGYKCALSQPSMAEQVKKLDLFLQSCCVDSEITNQIAQVILARHHVIGKE